MAKSGYITYQGQEILFYDHSGLRGKDLLNSLKEANQIVLNAPHSRTLFLADFSNTYIDSEIMAYLSSDEEKAATKKIRKTAAVGVSGIKKIFLNTYNTITQSGARAFDDLESAKQYLVS